MRGKRKPKTLTVKGIEKLPQGRYRDRESRGLYLQVTPSDTKSWIFRFEFNTTRTFYGPGCLSGFLIKASPGTRHSGTAVTDATVLIPLTPVMPE